MVSWVTKVIMAIPKIFLMFVFNLQLRKFLINRKGNWMNRLMLFYTRIWDPFRWMAVMIWARSHQAFNHMHTPLSSDPPVGTSCCLDISGRQTWKSPLAASPFFLLSDLWSFSLDLTAFFISLNLPYCPLFLFMK